MAFDDDFIGDPQLAFRFALRLPGAQLHFPERADLALYIDALARRKDSRLGASRAHDPDGSPLPIAELIAEGSMLSERLNDSRRWYFFTRLGTHYERRTHPIPGTACRRGGGGCHRRIATQAERSMAQPVDPDEPSPRGRRSTAMIPNAWDDLMRSYSRSWKQHGKRAKPWNDSPKRPTAAKRLFSMENDDELDDFE